MNIDQLIEKMGGLAGACAMFGWQGGTIHQVRDEIKRRLAKVGIVPNRDGVFVTVAFKQC